MSHRLLALFCVGILVACGGAEPSAEKSTLVVDRKDGVLADGADAVNVTVTVVDAKGGPAAGVAVALSATGEGNILSAPVATDEKGIAHGTLRSTAVGEKTLSANLVGVKSVALSQTVAIHFVPGAAAQLAFLVPPSNAQAGADLTPAVQIAVQDKQGNLLPSATNAISLALTTNTAGATLEGTTSAPAASGIATFPALHVARAGTGYTITAHAEGLTDAVSKPFDVTSGPAATLVFGVQPSKIVAGQLIGPAVTVVQRDALGNPASTPTAVTIALQGGASGASLKGTTTATSVNGVATFPDLSVELAGTGYALAATATGYAGATSNTFDVGPSLPDALATTLDLSPASLFADDRTPCVATLTVRDRFHNVVPGVGVTFDATGSNNRFTPDPATGTTGDSGVFTAQLVSGTAETKTVTARVADGFQVSKTVTFTANAPFGRNSNLRASTDHAMADGGETVLLTTTVLDGTRNPVVGAAVTFTSDEPTDQLSGQPIPTDANGVATTTLRATKASLHHLVAHVGSDFDLTTEVTFTPGPLSAYRSLLLGGAKPSYAADGAAFDNFIFVAMDANANPIPGIDVTFEADGTWAPSDHGTTNESGTVMASLSSTTAGVKTVVARVGSGFQLSTTATFDAGPAETVASSPTFKVSKSTVVADDVDYVEVTGTFLDANQNPVAFQPFVVTVSGTENTISPPAPWMTDATGSVAFRLSSKVAEAKTFIVTLGSASIRMEIDFVPGAPSPITSTLTASADTLPADGTARSTLTLTVLDAMGNKVRDEPVTLRISGTGNVTSPESTSGTTDENGVFELQLLSTRAETKQIEALVGALDLKKSITFLPGAPDSTTSSLKVSSGPFAADGNQQATLTVLVLDAQKNPLAGKDVLLAVTGSGNTLSATSGHTDDAGTFVATLASTTAELKTVTASVAGGLTLTSTVAFGTTPPSKSTSTLVVSPAQVAADGSATTSIVVKVLDAKGNPVPAHDVLLAASGSGNTFTPAAGKTDAGGLFTATLASTRAETKTVTATIDAFALSATVTFTPGAPAKAASSITVAAGSRPADGSATSAIAVTVLDPQGNPVAGQDVSLGASGSGNTLTPASGKTDANGVFAATLASTKAETKTLTATVAGFTLTASATFVPGVPVKSSSTIVVGPDKRLADGTATTGITVTVLDAQGNPVPSHDVTLSASGSANVFSAAAGTTDASGVFTATLASTRAETKTITATIDGFTLSGTVTFVPGAASKAVSTIVASPDNRIADGSATTSITVAVLDAQGNPLASRDVSLTASGTGNTLTPASGKTDASGLFTATLASTRAEAKTITATVDGISLTASATFLPGVPAKGTSLIALAPDARTADGTATTTVTVTVLDARGNPVPSHDVTLASSGSGNTFSAAAGKTDASGVFTATLASTKAETKTVTATIDAFTLSGTISFVPGTASKAVSTIVAAPDNRIADGSANTSITVTVLDAQGNPLASRDVSLTASGTGNTLTPASGKTDASGLFTATLASTKAEAKTITATVDGISLTASATFLPGVPAKATSLIALAPDDRIADGTTTTTVTVTVLDARGNAVPSHDVTLASSGSGNTFSAAAGKTDASGVFTATLASTKAETKTVTATIDAFTLVGSVNFVSGAPSSTGSRMAASPSNPVADGTAITTVTVLVVDAQGNPVPAHTVALAAGGTGNTLTPASGKTDAAGVFTATLASTVAEAKTLTATIDAFTLTSSVTFVAGSPAKATSSLVVGPDHMTADGSGTSNLTVTVHDAQGNPVARQPVSLAVSGSRNSLSTSGGVTDATGVFTATLVTRKAEVKTITATVDTFTLTATATFLPGPASAASSLVAVSPASLVADGQTKATIAVTVTDADGNPLANHDVQVTASGSGNSLQPGSGKTDASGVFTATLASSKAESKAISAVIDGFTLTGSVLFTPGAASAITSKMVASPASLTADGYTSTTLAVQVTDAQGNPVPAQAVSLTVDGTHNTLTPSSGTTDASGLFRANLSSTRAEKKTVTAIVDAFSLTTTVTFNAGSPDPSHSTVAVNPASLTANGVSHATFTVTVKDANDNPVPKAGVSFRLAGSQNLLSATFGQTGADGVVTVDASSTRAESKQFEANLGFFSLFTSVNFVAGPPDAAASQLVVRGTSSAIADGVEQVSLSALVSDAQGNPVPGATVSFGSSGARNTFTPPSATTGSDGIANTAFTSTKAEAKTATATVGGFTLSVPVSFTAGQPSASTSTLVASPSTVVADGVSTTTVTATLLDAQGNPVPSYPLWPVTSGSSNTVNPGYGNTDASGVFSFTVASTSTQTESVSVTLYGFNLSTTVTFVAGPPVKAYSTLTTTGTSLVADGAATADVTVVLGDAMGHPVPDFDVSLSASGSANTFGATSGKTGADGSFHTTLASTKAETKTITATAGTVSLTGSVTFRPGPEDAGASTYSLTPATVLADSVTPATFSLVLRDFHGNPVGGAAVSVWVSGSGNFPASDYGSTAADGTYSFSFTSNTVETKTLSVYAGALLFTPTVDFVPGDPDQGNSVIYVSPSVLVADGSATTTITVGARDAWGHAVPNVPVTLGASGSANSWNPGTTGTTAANGYFSATLASTKAETKTITASFGSVTLTGTAYFQPGAPNAGASSFTATPNSALADGSSSCGLSLTLRDAQGNPIPGQSVSFSATGSNNTFSTTSGTTNASGVVTTSLTSTKAETKTITAAVGSLNITTTVAFLSGNPSATNSSIVASPTSLVAGATTTITVTVKDTNGNAISGQPVTMSASGSANTFTPASGTTNASGVFVTAYSSTKAEAKTVTATAGSLNLPTNVTFNVGPPSQSRTTVIGSPSTLVANGTSNSTLTVTVLDASGNPIANQAVSLAVSGTGNTLSASSGTTNASGTFGATLASTKAEPKTVTATVAGFNVTGTVTFTAGAPSSSTSTLVASPSSFTAGASTTLTFTVLDAKGNPVTGQAVSISSTGSANTFTPASGTTNASGVFTSTFSSTKSEVKTVTATAGTLSLSTTFAVNPGVASASTSTVTVSPSSLVADGTSAATITVTARDSYSNVVPSTSIVVAVGGTAVTYSPSSGLTNGSGVFTSTLTSTYAETKTLTATFNGGFALSASVTFVPGAASSSTSTFTASPASLTAGGSTTLTFTLLDAKGNPLSGQAVSIGSTGTTNTISPASGTTSASGVFTATFSSTKAESKTVTATAGSLSLTTTVTFSVGAASSSRSTLVATPASLAAGSTSSLKVTVLDANGNPISGQAVSLSATGTTNTLTPASGTTAADGTFAATLASTKAEVKTVTATVGSFNLTTSVTFTTAAPSSSVSTIVASPTTLTVGSSTSLTVTAKDAYGNVLANQAVSLSAGGSANTFSPASGTTNSSGVFTATLTSTKAEAKAVTATIGSASVTTTVTFNPGAAVAGASSLTVNPTTPTVGSGTTLTVQLADTYGNAVPSQAVSIAVSGTTNSLSPTASGSTGSDGKFTSTLTSTKAEAKTITVTAPGFTLSGAVTFQTGPVSGTNSTVLATPTSVPANGTSSSTISVTVTDAYGNPLVNQTVQLSVAGTATLTQPALATDASGTTSGSVKSSTAGTVTITAVVNPGASQVTLAMQPTVSFTLSCTKVITSQLSETSPYGSSLVVSYSMSGGGGGTGGAAGSLWANGGGGGSSVIQAGGSTVNYAAGGTGGVAGSSVAPGANGSRASGSFTLGAGASLQVYVGGGGGAGGYNDGGGAGSGWYGGAGGASYSYQTSGGAGGTSTGGVATGNATSGASLIGGNGGGTYPGKGGSSGTGGAAGNGAGGGGGGGGFGAGGGCGGPSSLLPTAGGNSGATAPSANGETGGIGASSWLSSTTLPTAAGQGGTTQGGGGNAGLVILSYSATTCSL